MTTAQLRSAYLDGAAQFRPAYVSSLGPTISAPTMFARNSTTGHTYYQKGDPLETYRVASLTKVLTSYVLLQHYGTEEALLSQSVTIIEADLVAGNSGANLVLGDVLTLHGLLIDMILPSSNNATLAVARVIGQKILDEESASGDPVGRFIVAMNAAASEIGMNTATFVDSHGLSSSNRATPEDIVKVAEAAWKNAAFRRVAGMVSASIPVVRNGVSTVINVTHTSTLKTYPGVVGGKTGTLYTGGPITYNLMVFWKAPNGNIITACNIFSPSAAERTTDMEAVLGQLILDFPELSGPLIVPTLSIPGVIEVGATSARPRVTLAY